MSHRRVILVRPTVPIMIPLNNMRRALMRRSSITRRRPTIHPYRILRQATITHPTQAAPMTAVAGRVVRTIAARAAASTVARAARMTAGRAGLSTVGRAARHTDTITRTMPSISDTSPWTWPRLVGRGHAPKKCRAAITQLSRRFLNDGTPAAAKDQLSDFCSTALLRNCSTSAAPSPSRSAISVTGARPENGAARFRRFNQAGAWSAACSAASTSGR